MKNNRTLIYVFAALFLITLVLGIVGLSNKNTPSNNVAPTPINSNIAKITYEGDVQNIVSLEEKMSNFELVRANKDYSSDYLRVYIENNIVKVEIQKSGIPTASDDTPEVIKHEIKDIAVPAGVQGHMAKNEGNRVKIYTLDDNGRLYLSTFYADPHYFDKIDTYLFDIEKVSGFASLTTPLDDKQDVTFNYSLFKTEDGQYYTDYVFKEEGNTKITRLDNANPI